MICLSVRCWIFQRTESEGKKGKIGFFQRKSKIKQPTVSFFSQLYIQNENDTNMKRPLQIAGMLVAAIGLFLLVIDPSNRMGLLRTTSPVVVESFDQQQDYPNATDTNVTKPIEESIELNHPLTQKLVDEGPTAYTNKTTTLISPIKPNPPHHIVQPSSNTIRLRKSDKIYNHNTKKDHPIVLPDYQLIFFDIPKVASTEWKLFFDSIMSGHPYTNRGRVHDPNENNLLYLSDYSLQEARNMLNSPNWTRAVFVREPKERLLSAYLNKFVKEVDFFIRKCCNNFSNKEERRICIKELKKPRVGSNHSKRRARDFGTFLHYAQKDECRNPHWEPQIERYSTKVWRSMTFVGYFDTLAEDTRTLLSSLHNRTSGQSLWDEHGKTGYGTNGTSPFLSRRSEIHVTNAHAKLRQYFTSNDEAFVEKHWAAEWEQDFYHFEPFHLFR